MGGGQEVMGTSGSHQLLVTVISCPDTNLRVGASPAWGSDLIRKGCLGRRCETCYHRAEQVRVHAEKLSLNSLSNTFFLSASLLSSSSQSLPGECPGGNCPSFAGSVQRAADNTVIYSWVMQMGADDSVTYRGVITLKSPCCGSMCCVCELGLWDRGVWECVSDELPNSEIWAFVKTDLCTGVVWSCGAGLV